MTKMKKSLKAFVCLAIISCFLCVSGCAERKVIDGVEYDTYGLFNTSDKMNPDIHYELSWGNIVLGALLFETIIAPIYFYGFSLWEPVGKKTDIKGQGVK